jgi:hypothetical protein
MNVALSFEQLQTALQDFRAQTEADIVLHGTPRAVQVGDVIEPRTSRRPARRDGVDGVNIKWEEFKPFVFGTYPEYPDVATFTATVMGIAPPYAAGIREDTTVQPPIAHFMACHEVKSRVRSANLLGTVCALSGDSFHESPSGLSIEAVSIKPVRVIGAWLVRYSTLSFALDTLPPLTIPGISEDEVAALASSSRL